MKTIDWKALRPHVPLSPHASEYVERPGSAGEEIAQWIQAGRSPLLVGGPTGAGKSTELAHAARLLARSSLVCLAQLDRHENMRRLTPDRMLLRIAQWLGSIIAPTLRLSLSDGLRDSLQKADAVLAGRGVADQGSAETLLNHTVSEIMRLSEREHLSLLIDGLEKVPAGTNSLDLFDALASIRDVDLAVVVPWHAAFGPQAESVIRTGERFVPVRALEVQGPEGEVGRRALFEILLQRLHWNEAEFDPNAVVGALGFSLDEARARVAARRNLVNDAIRWSGGLPRVFLQLLADAGAYAKLRRSDPWPILEDLNDACADQSDSFRRLLLPGDVDSIRRAEGTSGSELELDRKIRLMSHGVLLERLRGGAPFLEVHPLAQAVLDSGIRHA